MSLAQLQYQPDGIFDTKRRLMLEVGLDTSPRLSKTLLRSSSLLVSFCHTEKSLETRKKPHLTLSRECQERS